MTSMAITDPEVLAFIRRTKAFGADGDSIAAYRAAYDAMSAAFHGSRPEGLRVDDALCGEATDPVPVRTYHGGTQARVLYFHGGGWVLGGLDSHDSICAEIAAQTRTTVTAVDYRLAPEHRHPAAYEDCETVLLAQAPPAIVVGDSAGGNLAAALAITHPGRVRAQVLIYPSLGGERLQLPSYDERAEAPLLATRDLAAFTQWRCAGPPPWDDPRFAPFAASDLAGLPPCFVSAAEHDPLRDDGPEWARRLAAAGVPAECVVEAELPHGHLRARHESRRAAAAFRRITDAIGAFSQPG